MCKQKLAKILLTFFILVSFLTLFLMAHQSIDERVQDNSHLEYNTARIVDVISDHTFFSDPDDPHFYGNPYDVRLGSIVYEIEVLRGTFAGLILEADYHMSSLADIHFEVGDRVSVRIFEFEGEINIVEIRHPERTEMLLAAIALFLIILSLIGGKRGILSVVGLVFSVICVMFLLIPLVVAGYPVVLITLIILILIIVTSITLLAGISTKGCCAILGSISGILLAMLFSYIVGKMLHISGYNMANAGAIVHLSDGARVNGLFISSVLVASIGAVMDSSMSVASALEEIKLADSDISMSDLFKAGFNISRDVMGTMSNTLILAFIGSSLSMMVFMYITNTSFNQFINNDFITMEIIKGLSGSFGIILAAPLTAFISAKLLTIKKDNLPYD